tara:strand:- start:4596 stop:5351 length:756 start_codon:yes stop_codon:yes gene_type:complete
MAKRFIDTKIWDKAWFRKLTPKNKLIWIYLLTRCDHAGIWDADWEAAEFFIGEWVGYDELPKEITEKMEYIKGEDQYYIPSFVEFQYGELRENSKPHLSVIKRLDEKGLLKCSQRVSSTLKDKDKVKDKVKNKEQRELEFMKNCKSVYKDKGMDDAELNNFVNYWTESSGLKMRFEKEKVFDISRRISRWMSNKKDNTKNSKSETSNFRKTPTGLYVAYCSKCGNKQTPNDHWQLRDGSSCCRVEYVPEKP